MLDIQRVINSFPPSIKAKLRPFYFKKGETIIRKGDNVDFGYFVIDGIDLITEVGINIAQAALGADIYIQTLDKKKVKIKIPAGTNSGQIFKLKGSGATHINRSGRGDLFVVVNIDVSSKLSAEEKRLFNELKKVMPANDEPTLRKPNKTNW